MASKLLLALLLCAAAFAQTEKGDRVAGAVVNAATGKPLARVQIHLRREPDAQSYGAMTTADGRFSITGIPPGSYSLRIERAGFSVPPDLPQEIEIGEAGTSNLHFALTPEGAITGRVTDAAGQPVEDVELRAESDFASPDSSRARTDANGGFRIGGLAPGRYRVRAIPQNTWTPPEQRSDGTTDVQDAPTWSRPVQVASAQETSGVEIRLARVPIVGVSGKIENPPPNAASTELLLESRDNGQRTSGGVKPDGTFHLWRLYPGDYELRAVWQLPDGSTVRSAPAGFHIEGANSIENLRLHPAAPMTVTGHVIFDDEAARPVHGAVTKIVLLDAGLHLSAVTADLAPDGAFRISNVPPGRYRPTLTWNGAYADAPLLDLTTAAPADLTIHASSAVASISGTTEPGAAVILTLDGPGSLPRVTDANPSGAFSFHSVAPGAYRIVALPQAERDAFLDRAADYRDLTEALTLAPRQKLSHNLQPRHLTGRP
jgi:protocatechuate 3,4-dioxygenase beta subunit